MYRPILVCGTPDEIASNPNFGERGFMPVEPEGTGFRQSEIWGYSVQRHTIWHHLAMHGQDQLRQKMAFSLSQIVAVGLPGSGMVFYEPTEDRLAFYDFFVKNAFGNYRECYSGHVSCVGLLCLNPAPVEMHLSTYSLRAPFF